MTQDLFDILLAAFSEWTKTGCVTVRGVEQTLVPPTTAPHQGIALSYDNNVGNFVWFCRQYFTFNRIVAHGTDLGGYGVILLDHQHVLLVKEDTEQPRTSSGVINVTRGVTSPNELLPPANEIRVGVDQYQN